MAKKTWKKSVNLDVYKDQAVSFCFRSSYESSTCLVTRLNSTELHRIFAGTIRYGSSHPQKTLTRIHVQLSFPRLFQIGSFATNSFNRLKRQRQRQKLNPPHRRELPEELSRNVVVLTCKSTAKGGSCDVYLIGTRHGSQVVFLELCDGRKVKFLTSQNLKDVKKFRHSEFRVAFEEASAYGGKVVLGDRHIKITLVRAWARMHLWLKLKAIYLAFFQATEPFLHKCTREIIVHERDQILSFNLLKVARQHSSVVAVVGKGHLPGIKKYWKQPIEAKQLRELHEMPSGLEGAASPMVLLAVAKLLCVTVAATTTIVSCIYFICKK
ncbi:uncharacterized protein [Euphorbia lathyris]|uniref:uncharacterized protein n=1 Tax=Euphorbia lathyris TaxID=212925 RepID=UPI0033132057